MSFREDDTLETPFVTNFRISSSVMPSIDEVKAMTTTGLRHLASQRTYLDVSIDIQPSYFILPELGVYKE